MKKVLFLFIFYLFLSLNFSGCSFSDNNPFSNKDALDKDYVPNNNNMLPVKKIEDTNSGVYLDNIGWGFVKDVNDKSNIVYNKTYIKLNNVKDVYYISEKFKPELVAAHGMIAFIMKDMDSVYTVDGKKSRGLMLSVEAWRDDGIEYSLLDGMKKEYKLIYLLYTFEGRIQISANDRQHKLEMIKLNLTDEQKNQLLLNSINECLVDRTQIYYNTLMNSCVTNAAEMINTVLPEDKQLKTSYLDGKIPNFNISMPTFFTKYFVRKGLGVRYETITPDNYRKFLDPNYEPQLYDANNSNLEVAEAEAEQKAEQLAIEVEEELQN